MEDVNQIYNLFHSVYEILVFKGKTYNINKMRYI